MCNEENEHEDRVQMSSSIVVVTEPVFRENWGSGSDQGMRPTLREAWPAWPAWLVAAED